MMLCRRAQPSSTASGTTPRSWFVVLTALIVFAYVICQLCARKEADRRVDELLRLLPAANRWSEPTGCRDSAIAFVGKGARWILPIATLIAMVIWTLAIAIR